MLLSAVPTMQRSLTSSDVSDEHTTKLSRRTTTSRLASSCTRRSRPSARRTGKPIPTDGSYAILWPAYIDKIVLNPKQSRQKHYTRGRSSTSQPPASKAQRTDEPLLSSSSASLEASAHAPLPPLPSSSDDLSLSLASSSSSSPCSTRATLSERAAGLQDVLDEIAKLRSEMRQAIAVQSAPSSGVSDGVQQRQHEQLQAATAQI